MYIYKQINKYLNKELIKWQKNCHFLLKTA